MENPEEIGNSKDSGRNFSSETTEYRQPPEQNVQPPCQPHMKRVSKASSLLIFCHKQLSLKLHTKVEETLLYEAQLCSLMKLDIDLWHIFCQMM